MFNILDTHNTNAYMHFKLYFPGTPDEIYANLNPKQLKCIEETLSKIHFIYPEYDTLTAFDMLNYDRKNKLYRNTDTAICEIMTNCLSELVNIAQQAEYERIGEIKIQSSSDDGGETFNYVLPSTLKISGLPLYIQDWLEKKSQDNENYYTGVCDIFDKDGNAGDAWNSDKFYTNIKKNTCWTAEQILYAHRNCGIIHDTRPGFTNITYATGCCQYCKNTLRRYNRELCKRIESYNNSYRANYLPQNLAPGTVCTGFVTQCNATGATQIPRPPGVGLEFNVSGIWNPLKMAELLFYALSKRSLFQINHKLSKPFIPPMIQWFMDEAAKLINDNCANERRYQYDSYQQIYFTGEHILMDEYDFKCAVYYPGSEKSYNTLCSSCLSNWKYTRSILYDLMKEWMLIWGSEVDMSLDNRYMFSTQLVKCKIYELKVTLT